MALQLSDAARQSAKPVSAMVSTLARPGQAVEQLSALNRAAHAQSSEALVPCRPAKEGRGLCSHGGLKAAVGSNSKAEP